VVGATGFEPVTSTV